MALGFMSCYYYFYNQKNNRNIQFRKREKELEAAAIAWVTALQREPKISYLLLV